jgi:hypothetical protein
MLTIERLAVTLSWRWRWVMSLLDSGFGVAVVITARKGICVMF